MPTLNASQIATIVRAAGFPNHHGPTMVAIAFAESSGNTEAQGTNTNGTKDTGLFQINDVHKGVAGTSSNVEEFRRQMKNPVTNATVAKDVYNRQGLNAWTAYKNGRHTPHMSKATTGWNNPADPDDIPGVTSLGVFDTVTGTAGEILDNIPALDPIMDLAGAVKSAVALVVDFLNRAGEWITDRGNWLRIAMVIGGGAMLVGGTYIVVSPHAPNVPMLKGLK